MDKSRLLFNLQLTLACWLLSCSGYSLAERNDDILKGKTAIQLKLFDSAFHFNRNVSAFNYKVLWQSESPLSQWSTQGLLHSRLVPDHALFVAQPETGVQYNGSEMVTFALNTTTPQATSFSLTVTAGAENFRGFFHSFAADETSGYRNVTLVDDKWNVVGHVRIAYLVIRPITKFNPVVEQYSNVDDVVYMGHRGTGVGRRTDLPEQFLENTIAAFNYACSKGADMIELDVQLSSDKVPIIYHDFFVRTFVVDRHNPTHNVSVTIPIKDVSFKNFGKISTNFIPHVRTHIDTEENQSFETLENVLKKVTPKCGINVEIKYPQLFRDLHWDGAVGVELNEYVDRIMEVLYAHSGDRKIVITSFHPDLCAMVQLKQNKFRVALLTSGDKSWETHPGFIYDPRAFSVELGTAFVQSLNMKGLSLLTNDVLAHPGHISYVHDRHLALYLWGDKLDSYERLTELKKSGVTALIFDKLDLLLAHKKS